MISLRLNIIDKQYRVIIKIYQIYINICAKEL